MQLVVWGLCPACKGTGKPIANVGGACGGCEGKGWVLGHEEVRLGCPASMAGTYFAAGPPPKGPA